MSRSQSGPEKIAVVSIQSQGIVVFVKGATVVGVHASACYWEAVFPDRAALH
jgi:hypothetical protein